MSDQQIDVRVRAQTTDLKQGMEEGAQSVQQTTARMREAVQNSTHRMREAFAKMREQTQTSMGGMHAPIDAVNGKLALLAATLAPVTVAFAALSAGRSIINSAEQLKELSDKSGVSVENLAGLEHAANMTGASAEGMGQALKFLNKNLSDAGQGNKELNHTFNELGVSVFDSQGKLRKADEVLIDLAEVFPRLQEADRVAVAMQLLGRAGTELVPALSGGKQALTDLITEGQRLNPVTQELAERADEFNDNLTKVSMAMRASLLPAVESLLPELNRMSMEMLTATKVFGGFWNALAGAGLTNPFKTYSEQVTSLTEEINELEAARKRYTAANSDTSGIDQALSQLRKKLEYFKALQEFEQKQNPQAGGGRGFVNPDRVQGENNTIKVTKLNTDKPAQPKAEKEPSFMSTCEAELAQMRLAYAQKNNLREMSKAEELKYWKDLSATYQLTSKDRAQILTKAANLELAVMREKAREGRELTALDIEEARRAALAKLALAEQEIKEQEALGQITNEQRLQTLREFERQRYDIEAAALEDRIKLAESDPNMNPVELEKLLSQRLELKRQYTLKERELMGQINIDKAGPEGNVFKSMESSFEQAMTGMATNAMTLRGALQNIWRQMFTSFVGEYITKKAAAEAADAIRQTTLWRSLFVTKAATDQAGAASGIAAKQGETTANVGQSAIEAAANAFKAMAGIPVVGPVLAVGAAAAAMSAVMGLLGGGGGSKTTTTSTRIPGGGGSGVSVPSAAGGFDIPAGVNPLTQLHEREMVLPQAQADAVRQMAEMGAGGTVVINATSGDFIHKRDLVKLLTQMKRDFRFA